MENWNEISTVSIEVPVRSAGNVVINQPVEFKVYKDSSKFKAVPNCDAEKKRLAMLKDEIVFYFRRDKAVADNGINDGNQHIVERIGDILRGQGLASN